MTLLDTLNDPNPSTRLQTALTAGTHADPTHTDALVTRCATEPDFFVRDMLTWALTRLPPETTVPRLLTELHSPNPQARSQALHTLSKIGDHGTWPAITRTLLHDPHDDVARSAWRAAVILAPTSEHPALAAELTTQLGRGDRTLRLSLSRAIATLADAAEPALTTALTNHDPTVRAHAHATRRLLHDPDAAFTPDIDEAIRIVALGPQQPDPTGETPC
ncbi:HEAT repeat domain-containing protein [Actinoplanes sp. NEAU-A12]|uniref:HEAT repeat domain-containing protein n=1 Tax=Actinoplanes sandaracinus TaxID=3045177 RepID=A0ABT6WZB0_9ACTN|nr:HEAT repeat domain-containing protein [Actinoplanes sandaracinus]MDI6105083.1 HEAT repeat domain-containing protein [Actinoplanes sandaracinus]